MIERFKKAGIDPNLDRWAEGIDHHPKSEELVRMVQSVDWLYFGGYFNWKIGGDGDSGETLMYELDPIFELLDKENDNAK